MIYFKKIAYPGKYQDDSAIPQLLGYIMRQDKTPHCLIGAVNIDNPVNPAESMIAVSEKYGKYSRIRLHHFIMMIMQFLISSTIFADQIKHLVTS